MPDILINVWTRLQGKSVDDTEKDLQKRFSKAGNDAGDNFAKEFERSLGSNNPRVRKAAERLADSSAVLAQNNRLRELSENRLAEASRVTGEVEARLIQLRRDGQGVSNTLMREENRLAAARQSSARAERDFIRDTSNFERAAARRVSAIKNLAEAQRSSGRGSGGGGRGGGRNGSFVGRELEQIPGLQGFGALGAKALVPAIGILGSVAEAVTTASQALWLLPAATVAAGAGFATLKIGMSGFDKALKDMGDPKKWAEDLQKLSPAAQQAALEIQHLVGGLDSVKKIVQESLFSGLAEQLHNLGNTFMPSLRQMFTGISGAFNQMFTGAIGQLTSAGTSAGIGNIMNNIVKGFQNLAPAMAPVVDAFVKITQVGSTFLPGLGSSITDLAQRFDDFITRAQQTGQLQHWIQQGLDAAKALGQFLGELAHKFYDVFGNKSPQQFADTLRGLVGTLTAVGQGIAGLSQVVNALVRDIQPVANALGGWPNLIRDMVAAWALWKVGSLIGQLGIVQGMLAGGLPAAAEAGATGINAALARIAMPAWIATFLALWNLHGDSGPGKSTTSLDDKKARSDALEAYGRDHGGQWLQGKDGKAYEDWLHGQGPIPDQLKQYYHAPAAAPGKPGNPGDKSKWGKNNPDWYDSWFDHAPNSAGMGPWSPYDVPGVPGKGGKGVGKDKDASPYGPGYDAPPRPGETEGEYSAEGAVMDAKHRLEEDRATLLNLQRDNNATAEEKQAQENKIAHDQREIYEAQMRLTEAQQSAYKKGLKGLKDADEEFSNIDQDFGLSKGLPGLVKNLIGMLGDLAVAPMMGQMKAIAAATGTDKNTFGMFGMMGQQNIAQGLSPILGIPGGQPGGLAGGGYPGAPSGVYGSAGGVYAMPSYSGAGGAPLAAGSGAQLAGYTAGAGAPNWDALAAKESSGNWGTNTGNGYFGGLQFDQATWNAYKPPGAPSNPALATKDQQIQAGQTAMDARGGPQSLWPQNYGQLSSGASGGPGAQSAAWSPRYNLAGGGGWFGGASAGGPGASGGIAGGPSVAQSGSDFGAHAGHPTVPAPDENTIRQWVQANFGIKNTFGTGSWENAAHDADGAWHHNLTHDKSVPGYAFDFNGTDPQMDALANWVSKNYSDKTLELIHQGPGFDPSGEIKNGKPYNYGPGLNAQHGGGPGGHVHWAMTAPPYAFPGGPDDGGIPNFGGSASPSGFGGVPGGPQQAQLTGFGQPDPDASSGPDPSAPPTPIGVPPGGGWQPAGGGANGIGGLPMAALTSAAGMFPGGGAAAQTAMQLANRTIGFGEQAGAIAVQGLMDTFKISDPDGDTKSDLSGGWFGRIAAGFAGARPASPNGAGSAPAAKKDADPTKDPAGPGGPGGPGGDTTHNGYGGINNFGTGNIILGQPNGQPGMGQTSDSLGAAASTPPSTSFGGMI